MSATPTLADKEKAVELLSALRGNAPIHSRWTPMELLVAGAIADGRERALDALKGDFRKLEKANVKALTLVDIGRMIDAHKMHGAALSVEEREAPEQPGEMEKVWRDVIEVQPGEWLVYDPQPRMCSDSVAHADRHLKRGEVCEVARADAGNFYTSIHLMMFPKAVFNSIVFQWPDKGRS